MIQESGRTEFSLEDDESAGWIVTYADLVTLLLVFFILLFSISSLNLEKFKFAMRSIQVNLGEEAPPISVLELISETESPEKKMSLEDVTGIKSREQEMLKDISDLIQEKKLGDHIVLMTAKGKIMIQIRGTVLFSSGAAALFEDARPILDDIVSIINDYPEYSINIKGHTDNIPIQTKSFPSNWELSSIRATTVLKHLIEKGVDPTRLTATGYADLLPIVSNDTEENRTKNRRVEFVLEKKTGPF